MLTFSYHGLLSFIISPPIFEYNYYTALLSNFHYESSKYIVSSLILKYNISNNIFTEDMIMDNNRQTQNTYKTLTFSKDNPIVEISSKQSQIQQQNITPPVKAKESKKE